jgi:hypothetical protein
MIEIELGDKEKERERERKKEMQSIRIASNWSKSLNYFLGAFLKSLLSCK